jgi:hypothetical protein
VAAAESSIGLFVAGAGRLRLQDVNIHAQDITVTNLDTIDFTVGGALQPDRRAGQRFYFGVNGTPESQLTAGPGSLACRVDEGALYVKATGTGNTGWLRLTG